MGSPSGEKNATEIFSDVNEISDIVGTSKDIAKANLGGNWRMPTSDELKELEANCTWEIERRNDVPGLE